MGYNTKFSGALALSRALTIPEAKVILEANAEPNTIVGNNLCFTYDKKQIFVPL